MTRSENQVNMFRETLLEIGMSDNDILTCSIFLTQEHHGTIPKSMSDLPGIKPGKPKLASELNFLKDFDLDALVYACGPPALVEACEKISQERGHDFKHETFLL
jgi:hypothetical protein